MEDALLPRPQALNDIYGTLRELVEGLGMREGGERVSVSSDTMRRRIQGQQPWHFEEVFDLARLQQEKGASAPVATAIIRGLKPLREPLPRPLTIPTSLREMLRLVGRLTTEIADTLEDGRIDRGEARRLADLLAEVLRLTHRIQIDMQPIIQST